MAKIRAAPTGPLRLLALPQTERRGFNRYQGSLPEEATKGKFEITLGSRLGAFQFLNRRRRGAMVERRLENNRPVGFRRFEGVAAGFAFVARGGGETGRELGNGHPTFRRCQRSKSRPPRSRGAAPNPGTGRTASQQDAGQRSRRRVGASDRGEAPRHHAAPRSRRQAERAQKLRENLGALVSGGGNDQRAVSAGSINAGSSVPARSGVRPGTKPCHVWPPSGATNAGPGSSPTPALPTRPKTEMGRFFVLRTGLGPEVRIARGRSSGGPRDLPARPGERARARLTPGTRPTKLPASCDTRCIG